MRRWTFLLIVLAFTFFSRTAVSQPATCPTLVSEALIAVGDTCSGIGRNQACYGNLSMLATARDPETELDFDAPGDLIGVTEVETLQLAALAPDVPEWGIAVMALQANFPDNLPGQNATIVLFGDVEIENRGEVTPPLPDVFVTGNNVNVRRSPSTSAAVVGRVGRMPQQVVGRLADGSWLRVALDDGTNGWVSASVVTVQGEAATVPEMVEGDEASSGFGAYGPMQAFRLRTGIGRTACSEAPADGILIQTPEGAAEIKLEINRVTVYFASTAVVRAQSGGDMRLTLLEGSSSVGSTPDNFVRLDPFQTVVIALDASGDPSGEVRVEEAQASDYGALPLGLLPRPVDVPVISADRPVASGIWFVKNDIEPDGVSCTAADGSGTPLGFADGEGEDVITVLGADEVFTADTTLARTGESSFAGSATLPLDYFGYTSAETSTTATFLSPTRVSIERSVTYSAPNGQICSWQISTDGRYLRQRPDVTSAAPGGTTSAAPGGTTNIAVLEGRWLRTTVTSAASEVENCGAIHSNESEVVITMVAADRFKQQVVGHENFVEYVLGDDGVWRYEAFPPPNYTKTEIEFTGATGTGSTAVTFSNTPAGTCTVTAVNTYQYLGE